MARQPSPHAEQLTAAVCELAEATLLNDTQRASDALTKIGERVAEVEPRVSVPLPQQLAVYRRDSWTCRYCGIRTVPIRVLRVISALYPQEFPHHPNWKAGQFHSAYLLVSTSLDHVKPGARGGGWTDPNNLATACWVCNTGKADFTLDELGWQLLGEDTVRSEWDGLTADYPRLWRRAGEPDERYHRPWLRLFAGPA